MNLALTGRHLIAGAWTAGSATFDSAPASGPARAYAMGTPEQVDAAAKAAEEAFWSFGYSSRAERAAFLDKIADEIEARGAAITEIGCQETGLPEARLNGERGRTVGQLRLFADHIEKGDYLDRRHDVALPDRQPLPRPDLKMVQRPIGPVAVFGASNFPLAFSTAGGDTAAALAAGCPVVVKGHPAHPGTSESVSRAIIAAVKMCGLPNGVFSIVNGTSNELGAALVAHPRIKAVGFTGSRAGGLALMKIAAERPEPIPVYAEMSSINPVVLLPGALAARAEALGKEFVASLTMGVGQFCTNPGLVLALEGPDLDKFSASAAAALGDVAPATMLTAGIHAAYEQGVQKLLGHDRVKLLARGSESTGKHCGRGALFSIAAEDVIKHPEVTEEVFGASSLIVRCKSEKELLDTLEHLEGQLTATLHITDDDLPIASRLLPTLERKAGRVLANGWPTGVEVTHAMVHGGPFPATSDSRSTSVGTLAIERFLRPVCYQDFPDALLPAALRRDAPKRPHRYDGVYKAE